MITPPYLPDYCIYEILKYLQNHHSTLFNCLLVNRLWCRATVPSLYANPFDCSTKNNYSIILTIILSLNKTEILRMKSQINHNNIQNINEKYKTLFEYSKYIKNLNCNMINSAILKWFKCGYSLLYYNHNNEIFDKFIPMFYQLILHQSINIKHLNISLYNINKNFDTKLFIKNLTQLNSLVIHINNFKSQEFLNDISNICLKLKKLEIDHNFNTYIKSPILRKICSIIQKQDNLEAFKATRCKSLSNDILLSLEYQKNSLIYIEFDNINLSRISFKNLIGLFNLKHLKFYYCKGLSLEQCEILKDASFKLETLEIKFNLFNNKFVIPFIIKYLGESLQKLVLIELIRPSFIKNIIIYCLNLITLEISIHSNNNLLLVFPYFRNLKISKLNLVIFPGRYNINEEDIIFINLANNLPINVKEIYFHFRSFYEFHDYLHLKTFLENCHNYFKIINLNYFIDIDILKIILNYIEKSNTNNLKFLGMLRSNRKVFNDEELLLLSKINSKGVRIDFPDILINNDDSFSLF